MPTLINKNGQDRTPPVQIVSADGAITIREGVVLITKGSAAAITLAAPTTADVGKRILITSLSAFAHTVTNSSPGFNNGSTASDVATFTGAIGNGFEVVGANLNGTLFWATVQLRNVTLA